MLKLLILFAHLVGTCLAIGAIVATDLRLLRRLADGRVRIAPPNPYVMRLITVALGLLVVTGSMMIWLGLRADPNYLANPKLQAKLMLVGLLTANAWVLHRFTFPKLAHARRVARWKPADFIRVAVPVAVSNSLWLYCAFLGIARPWSFQVSIGFVLGVGACLVASALVVVSGVLLLAAQDRTGIQPGWIDHLKRQLGALATALRV